MYLHILSDVEPQSSQVVQCWSRSGPFFWSRLRYQRVLKPNTIGRSVVCLGLMHVKAAESRPYLRWCGVVGKFGDGMVAQMSSPSLHDSK
ncbi:hypothetical protein AVEN_194112-1 [Araneus ventricosus]|uniref:Uncharacterized protein n=1 Tax=Araneus ventricosus TaxID=182803 RepID=A0A4Y2T9P1_ARAVE|nr:hypothetical protein AVEN_194112-1 [Araneus ventricosus]